jgi:hypothetical protein
VDDSHHVHFLASGGKRMFMKPSAMKRMADSLQVAPYDKAQPDWLTYLQLRELATAVDLELRSRNLNSHSGIDVQGFIWTSIQIEQSRYGRVNSSQATFLFLPHCPAPRLAPVERRHEPLAIRSIKYNLSLRGYSWQP